MVAVCCRWCGRGCGANGGFGAYGFAFPVCATGGGGELFGPDDVDAAGGGGERGDLEVGDGPVEVLKEGSGKGVFLCVEEFLRGEGLLVFPSWGLDGALAGGSG